MAELRHYKRALIFLLLIATCGQASPLKSGESNKGKPMGHLQFKNEEAVKLPLESEQNKLNEDDVCAEEEEMEGVDTRESFPKKTTLKEGDPEGPEKIRKPNEEGKHNFVEGQRRLDDLTTICPEELLKNQERAPQDPHRPKNDLRESNQLQNSTAESPEAATICPEELNKRKQQEQSAQTLLKIQKDSALFKLVQSKLLAKTPQEREKRQMYYNPADIVATTSQPKYRQKRPVKTYQQLQKQQYHNSFYPKPHRNYQSVPVRYQNNGNFENYYKVKRVGGNRRQYQQVKPVRLTSTTVKSTRGTIRKKFRPSPIFV